VNTGTAPVTAVAGRARGETVYTISSSGRAYGVTPEIHGVEITTGVFNSDFTATVTNGDPVLRDITITSGDGTRFEQGMTLTGTGIPGATTISSVSGDAGDPTSITMSANATQTGSAVAIAAAATSSEQIGLLITTNGVGSSTSAAIQSQSYSDDARYRRVINVGNSGIHPDGTVFRIASATATRGLSFESATITTGINFSSGSYTNLLSASSSTCSGAAWTFSSVTATIGINFASSNTFSTSAIHLAGQNISTDTTTGMKVATNSTQKLGFFGATPVVRPTVGAAATDAATTQTLANNMRTALINLGLVSAS
jgi:hypothetical protein